MQFANDGHICRAFTPQYAKAQLSPCAGWCLLRQQQVQQDSSNTHTHRLTDILTYKMRCFAHKQYDMAYSHNKRKSQCNKMCAGFVLRGRSPCVVGMQTSGCHVQKANTQIYSSLNFVFCYYVSDARGQLCLCVTACDCVCVGVN